MMTTQELSTRNFIDHYRGRKGPLIFIVSIHLMILVILLISVNEKTNIKDLLLIIVGFTCLISWILYWGYAKYNRIIACLEKSGVLSFLIQQGFQVRKEKSGLNYEISIQGHIDGCLIIVVVDKRKANIWGKYYLNIFGLPDDQSKWVEAKYLNKDRLKEYKEPVRLTKSTETKSKLEQSIGQFIKELGGQ
jgi:hypothetical protein